MREIELNDLFGTGHPHACLHDSYIDCITLNYVARTAVFDCRICSGNPNAKPDDPTREVWPPGRFTFTGLLFFAAQVPATSYCYEDEPLDVTNCEPWTPEIGERAGLMIPPDLPEEAFALLLYVNNWNRSLLIAATGVEFVWI